MRLKRLSILTTVILILAVLVAPVALAQTWNFSFPIEVLDTSGVARTYPPVLTGITGQSLVDSGHMTVTGTDTNMEISGTSVPYMLSTTQIATAPPALGAGSEVTFDLRTGYAPVQTEFPIIVGHNGYLTTLDDAILEPGSDFEFEQKGWVDTAYVANKHLAYKRAAFKTYVSAANDVTSAIGEGQPIVGGFDNTLNPAAIEYNCLMGGTSWDAVENQVYQCIPTGGTIDGLHMRLSAAPGAGDSYTFTLMVNGAPSALEVIISGAADTTGNDWGAIAVVAGDTVSLRSNFGGVPVAVTASWTTHWNPTIEGESICLAMIRARSAATLFGEIQGKAHDNSQIETQLQAPLPTAGTFKKLYVQLSADPGNAPEAYSFTLRQTLADTALTCTIVADDTTGNDAVNTVALAAGILVDIEITPLNVPAVEPWCAIGMVFVSDTDGESLIMGGTIDPPTVNATEYLNLCGTGEIGGGSWNAVEANRYSLIQSCIIKKLYVHLETAPGGADTYTVSIREAGGDTGLTVTIAGAATEGSDVVNTYTSPNGDVVDTRMVSSATAALTRIHWGLVASNPLAEVTTTVGASNDHTITTYGILDAQLDFVPGTFDYVNLPINNALLNFTSEDFTIVARVLTLDDLTTRRTLFSAGDYDVAGGTAGGYTFYVHGTGALRFYTVQAAASQGTVSFAGDLVAPGGPYTVGITRSGASCLLYKDGVDVTSVPAVHIDPVAFAGALEQPKIGMTYHSGIGNTYWYDGDIDEVSVFNRTLEPAEMLAIHNMYNAGADRTLLVTSDMIGLWRLGENAGVTTYDATANDIDGTLVGGPPAWVNKNDILAIADEGTGYIAEDYDNYTAGVPDNAVDWIWNQNDTMPYMDYIKETVSGVRQLWYEPGGMITATALLEAPGYRLLNRGFEIGDPPDDWVKSGAVMTFDRSNVQVHSGSYSGRVVREGTNCYIRQNISTFADYAGETVTYTKWVYATVANRARIRVYDGVGGTYSAYHTGVAGWENLTVTHIVTAVPTLLQVRGHVQNGDTTVYFDDALFGIGNSINTGTITWGANVNMTVTFGAVESYAATSAAIAETEIGYTVPAASMPTGWFGETALSPTLPFYQNFSDISTDTGIPIRSLYMVCVMAVAMGLGFGVFLVFKPMLIAFGVTGVILWAGSNMNIVPIWMLFTYGVVGIAVIYGRRQL